LGVLLLAAGSVLGKDHGIGSIITGHTPGAVPGVGSSPPQRKED